MSSSKDAVHEVRRLRERLMQKHQGCTLGDLTTHYRKKGQRLADELGLTTVPLRPRLWNPKPGGGFQP